MLETFDCLRTRSSIQEMKRLDNNILAIFTELNGARVLNLETCQTINAISHKNLNAETKAICFSKNAEFMAFSNKSYIFILHIASKEVLKTIKTDQEHIEHLSFDLESKYIIASTKSGRVLQYRYDGSSLIARLYSYERSESTKPAKASSFAFYANTMMCGSNNGILFSINLHSRANKSFIHNDKFQINALCFLNETTIASGDSRGNIYINSLKDNALIKKIETGFTTVKQIVLLPNPNYILVNAEEKNLALYELTTFKLLQHKYLKFESNIKKILLTEDKHLVVALENNLIQKLALQTPVKLKSYIVSNSLDKAFALVKQDPLLQATKEYKILEMAYNRVYKVALNELVKQNNEKAQEVTKMFKYVDGKNEDIQMLFKAFENYVSFKMLYMEKKYALAYAMSVRYPPLTKTFYYKKMEEIWNETFLNAQRQISHGQTKNAIALLNEYATVLEKRPMINLLLKHNKLFVTFMQAIESNDFQTITKIAARNAMFTLIPAYKNVEKELELYTQSIQKDIQKCDLPSAVKKLSKVQNIPSVKDIISTQKDECRGIKKLQDAYKVNNFIKCFEILDSNHFLNSTELGILLQTHWVKIISRCEVFALKGNVRDIKQTLGELIKLTTRRDKIGDLFRLAFHTKMKGLIHKKAYKKAESVIYSYIDIFGTDKELTIIMHTFEIKTKTKLALTQNNRVSRYQWVESDFIMGM